MSISIRPANVHDAASLRDLSISTFVDSFGHANKKEHIDAFIAEAMNLELLTAELNDEGNKFFFIYLDDTLCGFTKLRTTEMPDGLNATSPIEIERIYVSKEYHGQKVGATLMRHCIDYAMDNGHDVIWLGVWEHNQKAIDFYNRWGFTLFGSHIFMVGPDAQTDVLMRKDLEL